MKAEGAGQAVAVDYSTATPVSPASSATRPPLTWTLLIEPVGRPGAVNMAIDQALLDAVEARGGLGYLRLYRWHPPCLSFGRNEPALARYDRSEIERLGLDVVRRPTGGRAVWHDAELTYAVAAPVAAFGCLQDSYHAMHERLARALRAMGIEAILASPATRPGPLSDGACFAQPVGGEVLVGGRKVIGSAQVRQRGAFLQHGSILLGGSQDVVARVSRVPSPAANATSLSIALGRQVEFSEVARAITDTWLEDGEAAARGPAAHPPIRPSAFQNPAWTWRR